MKLLPSAVKDSETTDKCVQVFSVFDCAPGALIVQVAEEDPFLVDKGDQFFIPTFTTYRLQVLLSLCLIQRCYDLPVICLIQRGYDLPVAVAKTHAQAGRQ